MATVPLPDRGQPLDLAYIYQLAQGINNLSLQLSPTTAKYTTVSIGGNQTKSIRTSDSRVVGQVVTVDNGSATSGDVPFEFSFSAFAYAPVVTATPYASSSNGSEASKDVTVVLTSVTTNKVNGIVRFGSNGVASVDVHAIVVGIPV